MNLCFLVKVSDLLTLQWVRGCVLGWRTDKTSSIFFRDACLAYSILLGLNELLPDLLDVNGEEPIIIKSTVCAAERQSRPILSANSVSTPMTIRCKRSRVTSQDYPHDNDGSRTQIL